MIRSMILLLATTLAAASSVPTTSAKSPAMVFPDTAPGRHARAWFQAFNEGEPAMRRFFESHVSREALERRPIEHRLDVYREMRQQLGRLAAIRVIEGNDDELRVAARPDQGPAGLEIAFQCEGPDRTLAGVRIEDTRGDGGEDEDVGGDGAPLSRRAAGPPMTDAEVVAALRARVDSLAAADAFSGAVLLAKGDQVLLRNAWGLASRSDRLANRPDTKFNLGSINKAFTRVAIEQLAADGKLSLSDTIDRWLTDYPKDKGRRITIQHLVQHRGGTGDIFNQRYRVADPSRLRTVADWVDLIRDQPLEFEPGTRQEYSNAGYVLLGAIVEKASGQSYYDYVREHIYRPAGMTSSDHYARDEAVPNRSVGYTRRSEGGLKGELRSTLPQMNGRGSPAGGGYSTVDDLLRFTQAMRAGRLGVAAQEGLGIAGGSPGCNAVLEATGDYTLVVLANLDPPVAERVASEARGWLERAAAAPSGAGGGRRVRVGAGGHGGRRIHVGEGHGDAPDAAGDSAAPLRRRVRGGGPDDPHRRPKRALLPPGGVEVPMLRSAHLPAVEVMVNGQGPFRFAIDTGAAGTARIDSALAARLGLATVGEVLGGDPSGRNARRMSLMAVDSLAIGPARFIGLTAAASDFRQLPLGTEVDGILGLGLFADGLLTLDYPRERVLFVPGELPPADGAEVLAYQEDRGVPRVTMRVAGRELEADIDAGFSGGFILPEAMAPGLPLASEPKFARRGRTASNEIEIKAATLRGDVTLGRFTFAGPVIEFQPLFPMANVGSKILRDFSVTFDQKNHRMRLAKPDATARRAGATTK